jgi:hypothetical protein
MVGCVERGADQPSSPWYARLFRHASDVSGIVVLILNHLVLEFHYSSLWLIVFVPALALLSIV